MGAKISCAKSKRRDTVYIIAEIIEITREGAQKTRIMYKANLSFTQLNDYLIFMIEQNFISKSEDNKVYVATAKGIEYIRRHKQLTQLLQSGINVRKNRKKSTETLKKTSSSLDKNPNTVK
jgi:predicted transcriptional regulator